MRILLTFSETYGNIYYEESSLLCVFTIEMIFSQKNDLFHNKYNFKVAPNLWMECTFKRRIISVFSSGFSIWQSWHATKLDGLTLTLKNLMQWYTVHRHPIIYCVACSTIILFTKNCVHWSVRILFVVTSDCCNKSRLHKTLCKHYCSCKTCKQIQRCSMFDCGQVL